MGELRESSMLISLQALMAAERERVIAEQEQRLLAEQEAERREQEALIEAERAREQTILAARRRAEEEARLSREQEARLLAIKGAEIERVRLETEHRAALELLARKEQHERDLAVLRVSENRGSSRYFAWAGSALGLCVSIPVAVYFFAIAPANDGLRASYQAQIANERARAEEASRLARDAEIKRAYAEQELEARKLAGSLAEPAPLKPPPTASTLRTPPKGGKTIPQVGGRHGGPRCKNPDDPMDFCL